MLRVADGVRLGHTTAAKMTFRVTSRRISRRYTVKGHKMSQRLIDAKSRQRKYQLRHKRMGLCADCSRPIASGTLFCELHRRKRNLENRERQRKRFRRKIRYLKAESYKFRGSMRLLMKELGV
jgi:hypothetical protein